jgi:hypothetical protein
MFTVSFSTNIPLHIDRSRSPFFTISYVHREHQQLLGSVSPSMTSNFESLAAECLPTLPVMQPQAVVTIAVPVVVLGRVYPIHSKGVLWGSNPAIWMTMAVYTAMLLFC